MRSRTGWRMTAPGTWRRTLRHVGLTLDVRQAGTENLWSVYLDNTRLYLRSPKRAAFYASRDEAIDAVQHEARRRLLADAALLERTL